MVDYGYPSEQGSGGGDLTASYVLTQAAADLVNGQVIIPGPGIAIVIAGGFVTIETSGSAPGNVTSVSNLDGTLSISPTTGNVIVSIPSNVNLPGSPTTSTPSAFDSSTKIATTAYVLYALCQSLTDTGTVNLTNTSPKVRFANAAGGNVIYNLPAASGNTDKEFLIKKIDSSANTVTINANGSDKIDGNSSLVLTIPNIARYIHCDGTNWWIV